MNAVKKHYSGWSVLQQGLRDQVGWTKAWRDRDPEPNPDTAAMLFAGQRVMLARTSQGWCLHVERPNAAAIWQWLQRAASKWAKPPALPAGRPEPSHLHAKRQVAS
jgi:hypothetical protein